MLLYIFISCLIVTLVSFVVVCTEYQYSDFTRLFHCIILVMMTIATIFAGMLL